MRGVGAAAALLVLALVCVGDAAQGARAAGKPSTSSKKGGRGGGPAPPPPSSSSPSSSRPDPSAILSAGRSLRSADPLGAVEWYDMAVSGAGSASAAGASSKVKKDSEVVSMDGSGNSNPAAAATTGRGIAHIFGPAFTARLLEDQADALAHVKRYEDALQARERALSLRVEGPLKSSSTVADLVAGYAAIAQEMQNIGRYKDALAAITKAQTVSKLDPGSKSVLLKFEASVLECAGDLPSALSRLDEARALLLLAGAAGSSGGSKDAAALAREAPYVQEEAMQEHDILRQLVARLSNEGAGKVTASDPTLLATTLSRFNLARARLMNHGPWKIPEQTPKEYIPNLTARPFHDVETQWPSLLPVVEGLKEFAERLRAEYFELKSKSLMIRETECIQDATSTWTWFAPNGYWTPLDKDGCALATPAACALLRHLSSLNISNFTVLRTGYSAIGAGAHLRPHNGMTNAQLKFHLGLVVPQSTSSSSSSSSSLPCASLRVSNQTKRWEKGGVFMFDDSFEHEVHAEECGEERVVFQLVFLHPELAARRASASVTAAGKERGKSGGGGGVGGGFEVPASLKQGH